MLVSCAASSLLWRLLLTYKLPLGRSWCQVLRCLHQGQQSAISTGCMTLTRDLFERHTSLWREYSLSLQLHGERHHRLSSNQPVHVLMWAIELTNWRKVCYFGLIFVCGSQIVHSFHSSVAVRSAVLTTTPRVAGTHTRIMSPSVEVHQCTVPFRQIARTMQLLGHATLTTTTAQTLQRIMQLPPLL